MTPEGAIKRAILDALAKAGAFAFSTPSGKVKVRGGYVQLAPPGTPDITVIVPPRARFVGLEVKTPKGALRESQIKWQRDTARLGVVVRTVRSPEEAVLVYLDELRVERARDDMEAR